MRRVLSIPVKLQGPYRDYAFGGRALARWKRDLPPGRVAESWEVADRGPDQSRVLGGPLAGQTLASLLIKGFPLGRLSLDPLGRFPWLVKLLDVTTQLPLHLHPDDATAARLGLGEPGKHETWVILEASPGAKAFVGLKPDISIQAWRRTLESLYGEREEVWALTWEEHLETYPLAPGLVLDVPAGTPHAMRGEVVFYEVQRNSDLSLLADPWDLWGGLLPLETWQQTLDRFFLALDPFSRPSSISLPVLTPYYRLDWVRVDGTERRRFASPTVWTCVEGEITVKADEETVKVSRGETALVPAEADLVVSGHGMALWVGHREETP